MEKEEYMRYALELARQGRGRTSPNPLVGALLVKGGRIIGEGWHQKYGGNHAEINAFEDAEKVGNDSRGAEMYVTLEPCSHYGKTPPCARAIIEKGVRKVYVGMMDPNPLVAGKGVAMLQEAGIEVEVGILEKECRSVNEIFIKYITTGQPFVVMKTAMSLDGKIAAHTGDSKWVSSEESRRVVQEMRNGLTAIMAGIGTILADDPQLTCRLEGGRDPLRIIVDSRLRIPENAKVLKDDRVLIAATQDCDQKKRERLGKKVRILPEKDGMVDLQQLMVQLGQMGIDSILLEGGGTLNEAALRADIVDRVVCFVAPKIIGGRDAKTPVEGQGAQTISRAIQLKDMEIQKVGPDLLIQAVPERK